MKRQMMIRILAAVALFGVIVFAINMIGCAVGTKPTVSITKSGIKVKEDNRPIIAENIDMINQKICEEIYKDCNCIGRADCKLIKKIGNKK